MDANDDASIDSLDASPLPPTAARHSSAARHTLPTDTAEADNTVYLSDDDATESLNTAPRPTARLTPSAHHSTAAQRPPNPWRPPAPQDSDSDSPIDDDDSGDDDYMPGRQNKKKTVRRRRPVRVI